MTGEEFPLSYRFVPRRSYIELFALLRQAPAYYSKVYQRPPAISDAEEVLHKLPASVSFNSKMSVGVYSGNSLLAVVDWISGYPLPHVCFIGLLLISERYQRSGLGSRIVRDLELNRDISNKTVLRLAVVNSNFNVKSFWLRQGFTFKYTKPSLSFSAPIMIMEKRLEKPLERAD